MNEQSKTITSFKETLKASNSPIKVTFTGQSHGEIAVKEILFDLALSDKSIDDDLRYIFIKAALS